MIWITPLSIVSGGLTLIFSDILSSTLIVCRATHPHAELAHEGPKQGILVQFNFWRLLDYFRGLSSWVIIIVVNLFEIPKVAEAITVLVLFCFSFLLQFLASEVTKAKIISFVGLLISKLAKPIGFWV